MHKRLIMVCMNARYILLDLNLEKSCPVADRSFRFVSLRVSTRNQKMINAGKPRQRKHKRRSSRRTWLKCPPPCLCLILPAITLYVTLRVVRMFSAGTIGQNNLRVQSIENLPIPSRNAFIVINLKRRQDRWRCVKKEFDREEAEGLGTEPKSISPPTTSPARLIRTRQRTAPCLRRRRAPCSRPRARPPGRRTARTSG